MNGKEKIPIFAYTFLKIKENNNILSKVKFTLIK